MVLLYYNDDIIIKEVSSEKEGMDVKTLQNNGWWRITEYDEYGFLISESYEKE